MPTYSYRCGNCDFRFDLIQRFDDPDANTCPNCGHVNELVRIYKPVGVVFKGSGFYATDNNSKSGISTNGSKSSSTHEGGDSSTDKEKPAKTEPKKVENHASEKKDS